MYDSVKITVATPVFNGAATVKAALDSVVKQSYKNIEYVLVDGASSDDTLCILKDYADRYPSIIKYISEPDSGIYDAMNKAHQIATGDFLIFLGCDDVLFDDKVIENFTKEITDIKGVYYGDVFAKDTKEIWYGAFTTEKIIMQNISHQAIFYPKNIYSTFAYNLRYKLFADWDYNLRVWAYKGSFIRMELIVSIFAENGASISQDQLFLIERMQVVKQCFGSKYLWLLKMQKRKQQLIGNTDLRGLKALFFRKLR